MRIIYQTVQEGVLGPVFLKISIFVIVLQSSQGRPRGDVILNSPQMTLSFESTNLVLIKEMLVFKRTTNSSDPRNSVMRMVCCNAGLHPLGGAAVHCSARMMSSSIGYHITHTHPFCTHTDAHARTHIHTQTHTQIIIEFQLM